MKISQLTPIDKIRRDIQLPLSVAGQNASVTLGQILDATGVGVLPFARLFDSTPSPTSYINYSEGETPMAGEVVYDTRNNRFYCCVSVTTEAAGVPRYTHTLYAQWEGCEQYYRDGEVRTDCLFVSSEGRLYHFTGGDLMSAGVTQAQADQLSLNTPIEVASEEAMEQLIEAELVKPGQIYFIAEE